MEKAPNSLALELQAMAALGQVLGDLPDPAARQRVLKWAVERFVAEGLSVSPEALLSPIQALGKDPALVVDGLDEMFTSDGAGETDDDLAEFALPATEAVPVPPAQKLPLETVIRSFAADFQRFADEWNGATA